MVVSGKTIAIVFPTTIIIWEPGTNMSWRLDTPPVSCYYTWAHYLDPIKQIVSRFDWSSDALTVIMHDFSYGARESMQCTHPLKYSPLKRHDGGYGTDAQRVPCIRLKVAITLQNGLTAGLTNFVGQQFPALKHSATKNEWMLINHARIPQELYQSNDSVFITDDFLIFCSSFRNNLPNNARIHRILLLNEDRWIEWTHSSWRNLERIMKITGRYALVAVREGRSLRMQVRVLMGIHERRATERRFNEYSYSW